MTSDTVGGVWTYSIELARALHRFGITVGLATMGAPLSPEQAEESRDVPNLEIFESTYRLEWMNDPWDDVDAAGEWLLGIERDFRPEVVHLNGYVHGSLPWRAPVLVVGHSCVLSWWEAVRKKCAPCCWDKYRSEVSRGLLAARVVAAPSWAMLDALSRHYGEPRRGVVIANGRRPALFSASSKGAFILCAGRIWDEAKNLGALESVAKDLDWPICVAGENRHPDGGGKKCENVCHLGPLSPKTLAGWFARASIYALPARYEPFGLTALEAALSGCALVLGDIPSLREIWGDAALFVNPDSTAELKNVLIALIKDAPFRKAMAARAAARAVSFTPERMAAGYVEIYEELLRN